MNLSILWPDTHIPYEDVRAVNLIMQVASYYKPYLMEIIIMGDFGEYMGASRHPKHPLLNKQLVNDVEANNKYLDAIDREFSRAKKIFIEGNHEFRVERYIVDKCPELFGVTEIKRLLKIDQRPNWQWHAYDPNQKARVQKSSLYVRHEPLGPNAKASAQRAGCSMAHGHTHRIEEASVRGLNGDVHVNFSPGWLGDVRKGDIFNYVGGPHQWSLGFALVWCDGLQFQHQIIRIEQDGKHRWCMIGSKKFYE